MSLNLRVRVEISSICPVDSFGEAHRANLCLRICGNFEGLAGIQKCLSRGAP